MLARILGALPSLCVTVAFSIYVMGSGVPKTLDEALGGPAGTAWVAAIMIVSFALAVVAFAPPRILIMRTEVIIRVLAATVILGYVIALTAAPSHPWLTIGFGAAMVAHHCVIWHEITTRRMPNLRAAHHLAQQIQEGQ